VLLLGEKSLHFGSTSDHHRASIASTERYPRPRPRPRPIKPSVSGTDAESNLDAGAVEHRQPFALLAKAAL
jgi:hypothetical protein